jgi:hypothetical protein
MRRILVIVACAASFSAASCATYLDDLNRAERHYQANEHERALALFRVVESDLDSLSHADRTRYAYLRGMNDYRLGEAFRADARHWLALARALEREQPGGLQASWKDRLDEALKDLNQDVYGTGVFPEEPGDLGSENAKGASPRDKEPATDEADKPASEGASESDSL